MALLRLAMERVAGAGDIELTRGRAKGNTRSTVSQRSLQCVLRGVRCGRISGRDVLFSVLQRHKATVRPGVG